MALYSNLAQTATRLLKKFGQKITVTKCSIGDVDVLTGLATQQTLVFTGVGAMLDFEYRSFGEGVQHNSTIHSSSKRLLASTSSKIEPADTIEVGGEVYKVVVAKLVAPAGIRVVYDLWINR